MRFQGDRLREARKKKALSQASLGQKVGVSQNTVSRWETDGTDDMPAETLRLLLKALDVTEPFLRGLSDEPQSAKAAQRPETTGIPDQNNNDLMVRIQKSLAKAFDYDRHALQDLDDVRVVLRQCGHWMIAEGFALRFFFDAAIDAA